MSGLAAGATGLAVRVGRERFNMQTASPRRILVLGATGMLGQTTVRLLAAAPGLAVTGTVRSDAACGRFPEELRKTLIRDVDVRDATTLERVFRDIRPEVVINAVGVIKQRPECDDPRVAMPVNAELPHRLARLCAATGGRLIHLSTDCVFGGARGDYVEDDEPDAIDLYGRSKLMGEVVDGDAITIRTSLIGHELREGLGLLEWFLAQRGEVTGFTKAIFSGLPVVELACVLRDHVIPRPGLRGLFHVAGPPISKDALLRLLARVYDHPVEIIADDRVVIDRSLNATRFNRLTGYRPPPWPTLLRRLRDFG
ncbi:MAG TPA: SDR family oxidoreductase [Caulobacter sp.]|nr:SDR family oxidoreductase [Caulobacter sp.]